MAVPQVWREGTDSGRHSCPGGQSYIEDLHIGLPHIFAHPFIEDGDQEAAILISLHGTIRYLIAFLKACIIISFYYGNELDEIRLDFISEKAVNL